VAGAWVFVSFFVVELGGGAAGVVEVGFTTTEDDEDALEEAGPWTDEDLCLHFFVF
jgi:hypothetical protein